VLASSAATAIVVTVLEGRRSSNEVSMQTEPRTTPESAQVRAAVSLLTDPDPKIVAACRQRLIDWGDGSRPVLEDLARASDPSLRLQARSLLRALSLRGWLRDIGWFASRAARGGVSRGSFLEEGAILTTGVGRFRPGDADALRARIAGYSVELKPRVAGRSSDTAARHLGQYLALERRLTGSSERPVTPRTLHLDHVLEHGAGQPIALALLYILIGRRAGLELTAVRMPGYYLVRVHGRRRVLVDPYHDGRTVTRQDCLRYLRSNGHRGSLFLDDLDESDLLREYLETIRRSLRRCSDEDARAALQQAAMHFVTL
jgi:hypothetical protein